MLQKLFITIALTLGIACLAGASTDFTTYADLNGNIASPYKNLIKCVPQVSGQYALTLVVRQNVEAADRIEVAILRVYGGQRQQSIHPVSYRPAWDHRPDSQTVYRGQEINLSINWNGMGNPDGFPAALITKESQIQLRCKYFTQFEG